MRILISARMFGGVGGAQRALTSWLSALSEHEVYLYTSQDIESEFAVEMSHVSRLARWRVVGVGGRAGRRIFRMLRTFLMPRKLFDLYIHFYGAEYLGEICKCQLRVIMPSGNVIGELEELFDFVISESPDGKRLVCCPSKHVVIPPPTYLMSAISTPIYGLPEEFLLTVFNSYSSELKGDDILYEVAPHVSRKIVWCHSDVSHFGEYPEAPNVIHINNASQAELRFLYEKCTAYVSFSRSEGYGWAIADALLLNRPIVSRRIGVTTLFPNDIGIIEYSSIPELVDFLNSESFDVVAYPAAIVSPEVAVNNLHALVRSVQ